MSSLSHVDANGQARMVDVSAKPDTARSATASGTISMAQSVYDAIAEQTVAKGDVLGTARLAGIMGAKKTAELIPLCHPLALTDVVVDCALDPALPGVRVTATARTTGKTGVEMEALTAVSVALLTIYDMGKAMDHGMTLSAISLDEKTGGKSGPWRRG
jgi:cyclic pyranopterin phosphate synthase